MREETIPMFTDLPIDNPEGAKKKPKVNCLQEMLLELMNERKVEPVDIHKATGIPWGTLAAWYTGDVGCQMADDNLLKLARFFNVRLEYLVYGIGDDSPAFGEEAND